MVCECSDTIKLYPQESSKYRKHFNVKFVIKNMTKKIIWIDMFGVITAFRKLLFMKMAGHDLLK